MAFQRTAGVSMGDTHDIESTESRPAPRFYTIGGAGLALLGGAIVASQRFAGVELPPWLYYTAIGLLVLGIIECSLGRMTADAARDWNKSLVFALGLALLIRWPIAEPYRIPSGSMETTLHGDPGFGKGDRVFVNKWIYGVRYPFMNKRIWYGQPPQRWDIVVFKSVEPEAEHPTLVKRIVGMPGERIHISGGKVYVNGEPLEIPDFMPEGQEYTSGFSMKYGVRPEPEYSVVPEGHYLVLGDNSGNSRDGRYFGWLPNEHIVGRVASIWWPPQRWRDFTGFSETWWWNGLLAFLAGYTIIRLFIGRSWPTVNATRNGVDHVFVNSLAFGFRLPLTLTKLRHWGTPSRGDLVLYRPVGDARRDYELMLGRVAALGGEEVVIKEGRVHIDGAPQDGAVWLEHPITALAEPAHRFGVSGGDQAANRVPEGHIFLLTDYPEGADAVDSRSMGFVPVQQLMGKATCVWWPPSRIRKVGRN
jgi:signal peptidase I